MPVRIGDPFTDGEWAVSVDLAWVEFNRLVGSVQPGLAAGPACREAPGLFCPGRHGAHDGIVSDLNLDAWAHTSPVAGTVGISETAVTATPPTHYTFVGKEGGI